MKALGVAHIDPVGRFVNGSGKPLRVHKGFEQHNRMAENCLPIGQQSLLAQRQDAGGQIRKMPVGQDQKTAVICNQFQPIVLMAKVPSDPAIAGRTL